MANPIPVIYDVNVLVNALKESGDPYEWPSLPPRTPRSAADCVGVVNDRQEFGLWLSPHILRNTRRVLMEVGLSEDDADAYLSVLEEIAVASGGDVADPARTVHDCPDHEDNLVLDLAAHSGAMIIVSEDTDLTSMSPWRGTPILRSQDFASRVDASRRAAPSRRDQTTTDRLREQAQLRAARAAYDNPDSLFDQHPDRYRQIRHEFDQNYAQLRGVVDGWNPDNPTTSERITVWNSNLRTLESRSEKLDEVAKGDPETAAAALAELNDKMIFALERLDPHRSR